MKRIFAMLAILLLLFPALPVAAQYGGGPGQGGEPIQNWVLTVDGSITAQSTTCLGVAQTACTYLQLPSNVSAISAVIGGTWSATLQFEVSTTAAITPSTIDSATWTVVTPIVANGTFTVPAAGLTWMRVRCSAFTSGTATVTLNAMGNPALSVTPAMESINLGGVTVTPATQTAPYSLTIPALTGNDTLATLTNTQTLANKSLTGVPAITYAGGVQNISPNVFLQDDFCGNTPATTTTVGQLGWDVTVIVGGTDPVAAVASVANHPCLITLTDAATATDGVRISLGHAVGVLFPGATTNWSAEWIQEINQVATGSYRIGFATVDSATAIPTNGIYFRFLQGTDTYINACSDTTGTETCTATTVAPTAADYVDLYMTSTATGTVVFTVVDVTTPATSTVSLCASGCTAAATLPTVVLSPTFSEVETGSSVADLITVDYFGYLQTASR